MKKMGKKTVEQKLADAIAALPELAELPYGSDSRRWMFQAIDLLRQTLSQVAKG